MPYFQRFLVSIVGGLIPGSLSRTSWNGDWACEIISHGYPEYMFLCKIMPTNSARVHVLMVMLLVSCFDCMKFSFDGMELLAIGLSQLLAFPMAWRWREARAKRRLADLGLEQNGIYGVWGLFSSIFY